MAAMPVVLTIAGSDSSAGAGIQADLKTFAAFEVYGATAITAVTAQNTLGVSAIEAVSTQMVAAQITAVATDMHISAVKTGMLSDAGIIETVADQITLHGLRAIVVDPVMVASDGTRLLREDAVEMLRMRLLPLAAVVTPNAGEAAVLAGHPVRDIAEARAAAEAIYALGAMGPRFVVVTGGHFGADATDVLYDGAAFQEFRAPRQATASTHGTGCTFASAIAAGLARGLEVPQAMQNAKRFVSEAIAAGIPLGAGHGPLNHFYQSWEPR